MSSKSKVNGGPGEKGKKKRAVGRRGIDRKKTAYGGTVTC